MQYKFILLVFDEHGVMMTWQKFLRQCHHSFLPVQSQGYNSQVLTQIH